MKQQLLAGTLVLIWLTASVAPPCHGESRWPDERAVGPFACHADFSLDEFETLWPELAQLQIDLHQTLQVPMARERIHLFLFSRKGTYRQYVKRYFPTVPSRRALYIKDQRQGMVFAHLHDDFQTDLRHESTHALLHASLPMVPLWLDEGLAEYFELTPNKRAYDHPHMGKTRWGARFGQTPSIEKLERIGELRDMGQTEYRHAWAWVHYMLHGSQEAHSELIRFLADIEAQTPPGSLSDRLRRRIPALDEEFVKHFREWKR